MTAGRRTEKKSRPDSGIHLEGGNELEQNKYEAVQSVLNQVNQVILGKEQEVREIMLAILADGHILLEDMPGVGKTTLALAFSKALKLEFRRIQFTPDVLPSDLTGFSIYRREEERFVYQPGSVFCNLLLADEINRTSPKTQSALLEVMEERKVTVEGVTRPVPSPFLVIATQNPAGTAGTQLLPEAQMDRFMVSLSVGYPDFSSELAMALGVSSESRAEQVSPVLGGEELSFRLCSGSFPILLDRKEPGLPNGKEMYPWQPGGELQLQPAPLRCSFYPGFW